MANNQLIRKKVAEKLSYHRMQHTLGVEMVAMQLAKLHGVAEDKACTAALLHDYAKQLSGEELLEKAKALSAANPHEFALTIGPLSFVGLMAPHIARMMGFRRTLPHMVISGLTGGLLLVFADWCGRMMMFPYQIPAGLLSTFIGAPYFIYLLRKQSR